MMEKALRAAPEPRNLLIRLMLNVKENKLTSTHALYIKILKNTYHLELVPVLFEGDL